jgi:hypothetical protein
MAQEILVSAQLMLEASSTSYLASSAGLLTGLSIGIFSILTSNGHSPDPNGDVFHAAGPRWEVRKYEYDSSSHA